jgi:nitrite reductase/ring-hydroxylating ferredoxin subunit
MAQEYKLKGLSGLDLKPGEKREVEVDGIDGGKVLLCNVGGKVTALGSKCTHYGAPLVKGILTGKYPPQGHPGSRITNSFKSSRRQNYL